MKLNREYKPKPLPETVEAWENEVLGVDRYLGELKAVTDKVKSPWAEAQAKYYRHRRNVLLNSHPLGWSRRKVMRVYGAKSTS